MSILYTNAVLAVRSAQLLDVDKIRRMIAAPNVTDAANILYECGWESFDVETERARTLREFSDLSPNEILTEIINAKAEFELHGDADTNDVQTYYDLQFNRLKRLKNREIAAYFVAEIDLLNLRTFAKIRLFGGRPEGVYIKGGSVSYGECLELFRAHPENIKGAIANIDYSELLEYLMSGITSGKLAEFENASQKFLVRLSAVGSDNSFKLNMLFGWFIAKMEELRIVKTILVGKKFGKSREELRADLGGVL